MLSFVQYLDIKNIIYNKDRFAEDIQYRVVLWNKYGRRYKMSCNYKDIANDAYEYETEKRNYERKIRDYKEEQEKLCSYKK